MLLGSRFFAPDRFRSISKSSEQMSATGIPVDVTAEASFHTLDVQVRFFVHVRGAGSGS